MWMGISWSEVGTAKRSKGHQKELAGIFGGDGEVFKGALLKARQAFAKGQGCGFLYHVGALLLLISLLLLSLWCGAVWPGGTAVSDEMTTVKQFVYIYDFGSKFTEDVTKLEPNWYTIMYDAERRVHELLLKSEIYRTMDPEKASLFYIPFYAARFTLFHYKDWEVNMREAVEKTSEAWGELIGLVRNEFPYFNRTNGRDHFSLLTMDHGRCSALPFLPPYVYGEMFFLQQNGDKMVRSNQADVNRSMQTLTYNYRRSVDVTLPDIPCYMPDRDITIPPMVWVSDDPWSNNRNITALFRFSPWWHEGIFLSQHDHQIRKELFDVWEARNISGWLFGSKTEGATEWTSAKFCISPSGHAQWTGRWFKILLSGCIPVTFFREHDSPWQDELDYSQFSVIMDPSEVHSLKERIDVILADPPRLEKLQKNLFAVQDYFRWTGDLSSGVEDKMMRSLARRAEKLRSAKERMLSS